MELLKAVRNIAEYLAATIIFSTICVYLSLRTCIF